MNDEERQNKLNALYQSQNNMFDGRVSLSEYEQNQLLLTQFNKNTLNFEIPVFESIEKMQEMDESVFANWKIADIPVMVVAGGLGTLSSVLLRDFFANLHNHNWGEKPTRAGGHSEENIDWVPDAKKPGGVGHRWQFGHDLFNPFEVDWNQYKDLASQGGGFIPAWLKTPFLWLKHLLQDTFSREGLPLPGNSLLRYFLNPAQQREILQILGTIKMRDIAGAGITNVVMGAYVWGTEKDFKRVIFKPNYRGFSLMLGANLITLLSGLLVPPPLTSFNWGTIPVIGYYSFQLIKLEKEVRRQLKARDALLDKNQAALLRNNIALENAVLMNDEYYDEFVRYENDIVNFNMQTIVKHETLKKQLLLEGV
ncbi:MAG: hypothetical protein LBT00_04990 [Spirochaetaceae bacterium]|jgi:hypothetical protein|nr:hypothetical protein [Spirochaetaceae bacterium]